MKRKKLDFSLLQDELGVRIGYSPTSARQAISQIERGSVMVPARKLSPLVKELMLDETLFRQLAFYIDLGQYEEATKRLDQYFRQQFNYSMIEEKTVRQQQSNPQADARAQQPKADAQGTHPKEPGIEAKLEKLKKLFEAELINEQDYDAAKQDLLSKWLGN